MCVRACVCVQPLVHIVSTRIKLICRGKNITDDLTPLTMGVISETLIHAVLSQVVLVFIAPVQRGRVEQSTTS